MKNLKLWGYRLRVRTRNLYLRKGGSTPSIPTKVHRTKTRESGEWSTFPVFVYQITLLAQMNRAQRYGRCGWGFESLRVYKYEDKSRCLSGLKGQSAKLVRKLNRRFESYSRLIFHLYNIFKLKK